MRDSFLARRPIDEQQRLYFDEPAANGHGAICVHVGNPDCVSISLQHGLGWVGLSYWQLERIVMRVHEEYWELLEAERLANRSGEKPT